MEDNLENEVFETFFNKVDLHALDYSMCIQDVIAIAIEHGFRGIAVFSSRIEELVKEIIKSGEEIVPIAVVDQDGLLSTDIRTYSVLSCKEKGAKEIEIAVHPDHIISKSFQKIYDDIQGIVSNANKASINIRYIFDQFNLIDDTIRTKICRIIQSGKLKSISNSAYYEDGEVNHADSILKIRNMKSKIGCSTKAFVNSSDPEDIHAYVKAGIDLIGVDWVKGPRLIHAYQDLIEKKS